VGGKGGPRSASKKTTKINSFLGASTCSATKRVWLRDEYGNGDRSACGSASRFLVVSEGLWLAGAARLKARENAATRRHLSSATADNAYSHSCMSVICWAGDSHC
jgi:hypothetical protein